LAHRQQFCAAPRIIQQIRGSDQIEFGGRIEGACVAHHSAVIFSTSCGCVAIVAHTSGSRSAIAIDRSALDVSPTAPISTRRTRAHHHGVAVGVELGPVDRA
jgi:hypothetical protein